MRIPGIGELSILGFEYLIRNCAFVRRSMSDEAIMLVTLIFNTDQITLYANEKDEPDSYLLERH